MAEKKFDCYKCKYRAPRPGDCHSSCEHPDAKLGELASLNIKGNEHGIKNGWFFWPWNFDPVWLENCDGFLSKNEEKQTVNP